MSWSVKQDVMTATTTTLLHIVLRFHIYHETIGANSQNFGDFSQAEEQPSPCEISS